jgi:hypothetical protein
MVRKRAYVLRLRRAEATAERIWRRTIEQQPPDFARMWRAVNRYQRLYHHHDQMALARVSGFTS